MVDNKLKYFDESDVEVLPKPSVDVQSKYPDNILNPENAFLLSLVIFFLWSRFKILRMYWYKIMKPFWDNLVLVIEKKVQFACFITWH